MLSVLIVLPYLACLWASGTEFRRVIAFILIAEAFVLAMRVIDRLNRLTDESLGLYLRLSALRQFGYVLFTVLGASSFMAASSALMGMAVGSFIFLVLVFAVFILGS